MLNPFISENRLA